MNMIENTEDSPWENRFWLQIMGDHARFIYYSLSPNETDMVEKAKQFINIYDQLLEQSKNQLSASEAEKLNRTAYENTYRFREFKLQLLALTLKSKLKTHLPSSFFNHMLNELEEYMTTLNLLINNQATLFHPLHYNILWLSDAVGHSGSIAANLDEVEKDYIEKSMAFGKQFADLYMKSLEFQGYLRTDMMNFPALDRLNEQSYGIMTEFKEFLEQIKVQRLNAKLLGTLMPLMADHMAREECYYLTKLSESANGISKPNCNPASKRVES